VDDLPGQILMATVWIYWTGVLVMSVLSRLWFRQAAGLLPQKAAERLVWPAWALVIAAWVVLPRLALKDHHPLLQLPEGATSSSALYCLRLMASLVALGCLLVTIRCWVRMGRSWSIAVVPSAKTQLVTSDLYALVRHPIYALSILLMLTSMVVVPTIPMAAAGFAHIALMAFKARSEEHSLLGMHGAEYADYCRRTGRFFPRFSMRAP
jgi:protein-S-isoprenylcysteine O-methyltransferase Ste14